MAFCLPFVCLLITAQGGPATVPLRGVVVDIDAKPAADVEVWLENTSYREPSKVLAHARTDARGKFTLDRPAEAAGDSGLGGPLKLWAFRKGERIGRKWFYGSLPSPDEPVRMTIGPKAGVAVRVVRIDQTAIPNAMVRLPKTFNLPSTPPKTFLESISAKTNALGIAFLDGTVPEDIRSIEVQADGFGIQFGTFPRPVPGLLTIGLEPTGTLAGGLVADNPKTLAGWTVTAHISSSENNLFTHIYKYEMTTDVGGRFRASDLASGRLWVTFKAPEGSAYRVEGINELAIRPGRDTQIEVPLRRAVLVEGSVTEEKTGAPLAGVHVSVSGLSPPGASEDVVSDDKGRYACYMLPGLIRYSLPKPPKSHFRNPNVQNWADERLKENEARHTLSPIVLSPGVTVRGILLDDAEKPVAGDYVLGNWSSKDLGGSLMSVSDMTNAKGEFVLGSIAPGSEVRVYANIEWKHLFAGEQVVKKAGEESPRLTLHLLRGETTSLKGRVLDRHGEPLKDALIQVLAGKTTDKFSFENPFSFDDAPLIRTNNDGVFQTPKELPSGWRYRIEAIALGTDRSKTDWINPPEYKMPDLVLEPAKSKRTVVGRVVDRQGVPVVDAVVNQTGEGPSRIEVHTDREGRFSAPGMPQGAALLFVRKKGYRFQGLRVGAADKTVRIVVARTDEPATSLPPLKARMTRNEERSLAKKVLEPIASGLLDPPQGPTQSLAIETAARLDPQKMFDMIEDQVLMYVAASAFPSAVLAVYENDPAGAIAAVEANHEPWSAAAAYLTLFDHTDATDRIRQRDLLQRALVEARKVAEPRGKAGCLSLVGEGFLDIGETKSGTLAIREAEAVVPRLSENDSYYGLRGFIPALARIDLPEALAYLEGKKRPKPSDIREHDQLMSRIVNSTAASHPVEALWLLNEWKGSLGRGGPPQWACCAIAGQDLPAARRLAMGVSNPAAGAWLLGWMAIVRVDLDREGARALLAEAFDQLDELSLTGQGDRLRKNVAGRMASLLTVAKRVDPDRLPEYLWRSLAARGPVPDKPEDPWFAVIAALAVQVSRYDREAADVVFAPIREPLLKNLADRSGSHFMFGQRNPLPIIAAFDPHFALALIDLLPKEDHPEKHWEYTQRTARIELARMLALPPAEREREVMEFLRLPDPVDRRNRRPDSDEEMSTTKQQ